MPPEIEKNAPARNVLVVKTKNASGVSYKPVVIEGEDLLSGFVIKQRRESENRITSLKTPPSDFLAHGRRRPSRQRGNIVKSKQRQLPKEMVLLAVLKGSAFAPVEIIEEGGRKRIKLAGFEDELQKNWWTFVKKSGKLEEVADAYKSFPEGLAILIEAFRLRTIIRDGTAKESDKAHKVYYNQLIPWVSSIPEEYSYLFAPIFGEITRVIPPRT